MNIHYRVNKYIIRIQILKFIDKDNWKIIKNYLGYYYKQERHAYESKNHYISITN